MNTIKSLTISAVMALSFMRCNPEPQRLEKEGALVYLVNDSGLRTSEGFHTIERLEEQEKYLGRLGSLTYLIDENGKTFSPGFHEISPRSYGYDAKHGVCEYELSLNGEVKSASSQSCLDKLIDNKNSFKR